MPVTATFGTPEYDGFDIKVPITMSDDVWYVSPNDFALQRISGSVAGISKELIHREAISGETTDRRKYDLLLNIPANTVGALQLTPGGKIIKSAADIDDTLSGSTLSLPIDTTVPEIEYRKIPERIIPNEPFAFIFGFNTEIRGTSVADFDVVPNTLPLSEVSIYRSTFMGEPDNLPAFSTTSSDWAVYSGTEGAKYIAVYFGWDNTLELNSVDLELNDSVLTLGNLDFETISVYPKKGAINALGVEGAAPNVDIPALTFHKNTAFSQTFEIASATASVTLSMINNVPAGITVTATGTTITIAGTTTAAVGTGVFSFKMTDTIGSRTINVNYKVAPASVGGGVGEEGEGGAGGANAPVITFANPTLYRNEDFTATGTVTGTALGDIQVDGILRGWTYTVTGSATSKTIKVTGYAGNEVLEGTWNITVKHGTNQTATKDVTYNIASKTPTISVPGGTMRLIKGDVTTRYIGVGNFPTSGTVKSELTLLDSELDVNVDTGLQNLIIIGEPDKDVTSGTFSITVGNDAGEVTATQAYEIITPTAPTKMTGIVANPRIGGIRLSWTTVDNGGRAISKYEVRYKLSSASTWGSWTDVGVAAIGRKWFDTPIDPDAGQQTFFTGNVNYDFQIRASNTVGTGPASDTITAKPLLRSWSAGTPNQYALAHINGNIYAFDDSGTKTVLHKFDYYGNADSANDITLAPENMDANAGTYGNSKIYVVPFASGANTMQKCRVFNMDGTERTAEAFDIQRVSDGTIRSITFVEKENDTNDYLYMTSQINPGGAEDLEVFTTAGTRVTAREAEINVAVNEDRAITFDSEQQILYGVDETQTGSGTTEDPTRFHFVYTGYNFVGDKFAQTLDLPTTETGISITGITFAKDHIFVLNNYSKRVWVYPAFVITKAQRPGPVQFLNATRQGETLIVQWNAPASDGGSPITGYRYRTNIGSSGGTFGAWVETSGLSVNLIVAGLQGATVRIQVAARNGVGWGPHVQTVGQFIPEYPEIRLGGNNNLGVQIVRGTRPFSYSLVSYVYVTQNYTFTGGAATPQEWGFGNTGENVGGGFPNYYGFPSTVPASVVVADCATSEVTLSGGGDAVDPEGNVIGSIRFTLQACNNVACDSATTPNISFSQS